MKYILLTLSMLIATTAQSQTVITYDDGSSYTLKHNESAYVTHRKLFTSVGSYEKGFFKIVEAKPNKKRDYQAPQPDPDTIDPETGLQYCDTVPGWPFTFGGYTQCVERQEENDGLTFGG